MGIKYHQYGCGNDYGMIITLQIIGIQIMTMDHNTLKFTSISILRHICMTKILPPLDLHRMKREMSGMLQQAK